MRKLVTIDADSHITEPGDLWENYIAPQYRETCPKIWIQEDGGQRFRIDEHQSFVTYSETAKMSIAAAVLFGARDGSVSMNLNYFEGEQGGFDPHPRIKWMDKEGIDATFLFPTMALVTMHSIVDPERAVAIADAYNRWLADFCKPYPDRLFGVAYIPLVSVEGSMAQVRKAKAMGMNAGCLRPNPVAGRVLHHPDHYPLWQVCQDLDFAIAVHGGSGQDNLGVDRFGSGYESAAMSNIATINTLKSTAVEHCFTHTAEMMSAVTSFVMSGICDKFPKLRVGFMEAGGGWIPAYVERMDRHFDDVGFNDTGLTTRPSAIFRRQCFASFEPIETSLKYLAEYLGPETILWSSDYPHSDGFPGSVQMIRDMQIKPEIEAAILADGAKRFYGLM